MLWVSDPLSFALYLKHEESLLSRVKLEEEWVKKARSRVFRVETGKNGSRPIQGPIL